MLFTFSTCTFSILAQIRWFDFDGAYFPTSFANPATGCVDREPYDRSVALNVGGHRERVFYSLGVPLRSSWRGQPSLPPPARGRAARLLPPALPIFPGQRSRSPERWISTAYLALLGFAYVTPPVGGRETRPDWPVAVVVSLDPPLLSFFFWCFPLLFGRQGPKAQTHPHVVAPAPSFQLIIPVSKGWPHIVNADLYIFSACSIFQIWENLGFKSIMITQQQQ